MSEKRFLEREDWARVGDLKKRDKHVLEDAKRRSRSDLELNEWAKQGWAYAAEALREPKPVGHIAVEDGRKLSVEDFVARYERPNIPCMISHLADEWPAANGSWTPASLFSNYRHRRFKVGEDDDGYPVKIKLKYFARYMANSAMRDDSPLYVFDSMYLEKAGGGGDDKKHKASCPILHDYAVPKYFREDLFSLVGEHRRPPYRWMLLGPARSGTRLHIDPLATSAWNTLIYGLKRWVLFPPEFSLDELKGRRFVKKDAGEDDEAIDYFNRILPRVLEAGGPRVRASMIEIVQRPGETIFVPGGWLHAVLNITDTVAVTQNFASTANFPRVWRAARDGRRGMSRKWLRLLQAKRPDLAAVADKINVEDGWSMDAAAALHKRHVAERASKRRARKAKAAALAASKAARRAAGEESDTSSGSDSDSDSSTDSDASSGSVTSDSDSSTSSSSDEEVAGAAAAAGGAKGKGKGKAKSSDSDSEDEDGRDSRGAVGGAGAPASRRGSAGSGAAAAAKSTKPATAAAGGAGTGSPAAKKARR